MAHVRQQLRDAVSAVLSADAALTGKVFVNRVDPLNEAQDLPCLLVLVTDEAIEAEAMAVRLLNRRITFTVEIVAKLDGSFDDTLEDLATAAEVALAAPTFPVKLLDLRLTAASKGRPNGEGQSNLMLLRLTYEAWGQTLEDDPETFI
ncbi:hypothetical protein [Aestuariivirga litoralis]|uniref:hypothetical protein n=1 Tax=Aestuariivirga litoralis TaxID=2650924 RepID=UPI0018C60FAF|nr:hypothetical protein [Aestuariivirga litoralis]MBG1232975.1 hypothetical protein [Aestuariivirga litoralis]